MSDPTTPGHEPPAQGAPAASAQPATETASGTGTGKVDGTADANTTPAGENVTRAAEVAAAEPVQATSGGSGNGKSRDGTKKGNGSNGGKDGKGKHPVFEHAESIAKLATVVLGGLYVLGVLISNVQLMELGISDFASLLQTRNILTGFFFVVYIVLLLITLLPIAATIFALIRTPASMRSLTGLAWLGGTLAAGALVFFGWALMAGELLGYLSPWAASFNEEIAAGMPWLTRIFPEIASVAPRSTPTTLAQSYEVYWHLKIVAASLFITAFLVLLLLNLPFENPASKGGSAGGRISFVGLGVFLLVFVFPLLLFDYADEVYPNFKYNLGGGQPQVAEVVLAGKKSDMAGSTAVASLGSPLWSEPNNAEQAIITDELAIWYQSDKFMYVTSLRGFVPGPPTPAKVVAIDLKLVRNVRYLPKYVQVYFGGSIREIRERPAAAKPAGTSPANRQAAFVWAQLHPDGGSGEGQLIARAVVEDGAACPSLTLADPDDPKGKAKPMEPRWSESQGAFPIKVCEAAYPGNLVARIGATTLKPRPTDPKKILVIGDTGCRLAKWGMQDCNDPDEWPFQKLAERAAGLDPDLIIHVGDYQYREACLEADAGKCAGLALGDVWPAWRKDFFEPAGELLSSAPWVMLRGNHEDMARAGAGWLRLFSPFPRSPGEVPLPDDIRPYLLRLGSLTLAVLDVANEREAAAALVRGELYARWIERLAPRFPADATRQNWLFLHVPPWVHHGCKEGDKDCKQEPDATDTLNPMRDRLRAGPPPKFDLVFAGDTHMFQFFVPRDRKIPAQVIAGMSGTLLEAKRAYDAAPLDKPVGIDLDGTAGDLWMHHGFGYLVLTKEASAWSATLYDIGGKKVVGCSLDSAALDGAQSKFPCQ